MDLTELLASLLNPGGEQSILGATAVGDHNNPALLQAQMARFQQPPQMQASAPPQGAPQPMQGQQAPQQPPMPQNAPQAAPAPQGGGLGGFLSNLINPQNAGKTRTVGWLQEQGLDPGTATVLASDKGALRSYLMQKSKGGGPNEYDQRAAAAQQYGLDPATPGGRDFILSGKLPEELATVGGQKTHTVINAGNGMLYDQDKGQWITAPPASGLAGLNTDPNNAPILAPGQRDDSFLSTLDPGTRGIIKGVSNYELDPTKISSLKGNAREQMIAAVKRYDPSFDMTQYATRQAMRKSMTSGDYSKSINSANLVIQHLDSLDKKVGALGTTDYPMVNWGINTYTNQTGAPALKDFSTVADAAASELAKVFKGTGASSEEEIKNWRSNLDPNASPAQLKAAIHTAITDLLGSRLDTIRSQYQATMGKPADFTILTPHSRDVLKSLGVDPAQLEQGSAGVSGPGTPAPTPAPDATPPSFGSNKDVFDAISAGKLKIGDEIIVNGQRMRVDP